MSASAVSEGAHAVLAGGDDDLYVGYCRGVVALQGNFIDKSAATVLARGVVPKDCQAKRDERDGAGGYHVTFLVKADILQIVDSLRRAQEESSEVPWLEELPAEVSRPKPEDQASVVKAAAELAASQPAGLRCAPLGLGKGQEQGSEAYFVVLHWPAGQAARRKMGLPAHDFHITLGFSSHDVHGCTKGLPSIVAGHIEVEALDSLTGILQAFIQSGLSSANMADVEVVMEIAQAASHTASECNSNSSKQAACLEALCLVAGQMKRPATVLEHADRLLNVDSFNEVALRSRGFALVMLKRFREAKPALEAAREQLHQVQDENERTIIQERLQKCLEVCQKRGGSAKEQHGTAAGALQFTDEDFDRDFLDDRKLKFPSTAHLKNLGGATKDDKICDAARQKLFCGSGRLVTVEEKIDGANLGISLDSQYTPRLQGRSKYVNWKTDLQFSGLEQWLEEHRAALSEILERNRHILFGEWCQCLHTVEYNRLPGYFIAFDIFDRAAGRYLSRTAVHARLGEAPSPKIPVVPLVTQQKFATVAEVEALLTQMSAFGDGPLEGVYLRIDETVPAGSNSETYLEDRCKLVRAEFRHAVDTEGSWRGRGKNRLDLEFAQVYVEQCFALDPSKTKPEAATAGAAEAAGDVEEAPSGSGGAGRGNYPSTPHLPFSPGVQDDDIKLTDGESLVGREVIVTEKLDGGNCCIKGGQVYARTHSQPATHESFSAVKQLVSSFPTELGEVELYGENMTAVHSIEYTNLTSYLYIFGARRNGEWLSWDEVCKLAEKLTVPTVPVLFKGRFASMSEMQQCFERWAQEASAVGSAVLPEGFVVRVVGTISSKAFDHSIAKYVRANHIQTEPTWRRKWRKAALGSPLPVQPLRTVEADPLRARLSDPRVRHKCSLPGGKEIELQRNFSFILDEVAVSSTPKSQEQVSAMANLGIKLVVTLTEETPLPGSWFEDGSVNNLFVPVTNFEPPSVEQVDNIIAAILQVVSAGNKALVHCGGGKGRAGSVAACLLLRFGDSSIAAGSQGPIRCRMRSDEVLEFLRHIRPGSVETVMQEQFVREYASLLWRRAAEASDEDAEDWEERSQLEAEGCLAADLFESASSVSGGRADGKSVTSIGRSSNRGSLKARQAEQDQERRRREVAKRAPKFVVMTGLAGAGKSKFSKSMEASGSWVRANQDDFKRKGYQTLVTDTVPLVRQGRTHLVIDRCNLTPSERAEVLDLLGSPSPADVVSIFFDMPVEDCKRRAAARENHPTIAKGGGARIIERQAKTLVKPEKSEGFGAVETVRSFEEAGALLQRYGIDETDYLVELAQLQKQEASRANEGMVDGETAEAVEEEEKEVETEERKSLLPESFAAWLQVALLEELSEDDAEALLAAVEVILENADEDPEAVEAATFVLADSGAPSTSDRLGERWRLAVGQKR